MTAEIAVVRAWLPPAVQGGTARWLRFASISTILTVRTPVHASMLYVSSRYKRASLPWRIFR